MIDQTEWVLSVDHSQRFDHVYPSCYDDLEIQIELDDQVLASGTLASALQVEHWFEDSESLTQHCLKIKFSGFKESHQTYLAGIGEVSLMIKIDQICIEQLSLRTAFGDHGKYHLTDSDEIEMPSEFVGRNGVHQLNFTTPIYPWLLSVGSAFDYFNG